MNSHLYISVPNTTDFLPSHHNEQQVVGCPLCSYIKFTYLEERLRAGGVAILL